jgi:methylenetetrahydrofolate reductase (NADPH)
LGRLARWLEKEAKHLGYACQDCGDCSLAECGFLCPVAGCPKGMRNGPCGGSFDGRCEVDDRECFWIRVYQRLRHEGQSESLSGGPVVVYHADLKNTSAWANFYLGRDHHARPDQPEHEQVNRKPDHSTDLQAEGKGPPQDGN